MCFSPQRRATFQHLNFKKWSETVSFLAFWLQNVLLATAACNFWFLLWPHDSAPAALTSLLFDSPDARTIGKTQRFATPLTFGADVSSFFWLSRYCIFFLLTLLHLLTLLSSDFTSSHLLFICFSTLHIVGSLLFKLPSIMVIWWICVSVNNASTCVCVCHVYSFASIKTTAASYHTQLNSHRLWVTYSRLIGTDHRFYSITSSYHVLQYWYIIYIYIFSFNTHLDYK